MMSVKRSPLTTYILLPSRLNGNSLFLGRQNLVVAAHALFSHLAADKGDLRLQGKFLRAEVVAGKERHAAEHAGLVADDVVVVSIVAGVARVETEASVCRRRCGKFLI